MEKGVQDDLWNDRVERDDLKSILEGSEDHDMAV